jgi:predicted Zn-dependent peptidase
MVGTMKPTFEVLSNGIRLVVARNPNLNSVVVKAGVHVGSRHEPEGLHGAAHFVEHVIFKGTPRRPTAKDVTIEIEARGGNFNAFTDKEFTGFHVKMSKLDGKVGVDVIHDILDNALFRSKDVEKERPVIREEISMYNNDPNSNAWELSERHAFAGTGLAHRITGDIEDVSFSPEKLKKFFYSFYLPERTIVVLSGAVDNQTIRMAKSKFGSMRAKVARTMVVREPLIDVTPTLRPGRDFQEGKTDRLTIYVRFPGVPSINPTVNPLTLVSVLLGGYSAARLHQSLREDKSLCYSVGSATYGYSDVGSFIISTALDRPKFVPAMKAIIKEVSDIRKNGVKAEELETAKTCIRGTKLLELDNPMCVAADILRQIFTDGSYELPENTIKKVMRVRASEATEVAREFMDPAKMHVSVVGPAAAKKEVLSALDGLM